MHDHRSDQHGVQYRKPLAIFRSQSGGVQCESADGIQGAWAPHSLLATATGAKVPPARGRNPPQARIRAASGSWFKSSLGEFMAGLFARSALADDGYLSRIRPLSIMTDHREKGINHSYRLRILLNLEVWYRIFITNKRINNLSTLAEEHVPSSEG